MGDVFSTTRGGFYGVWQPLQIGHRQAAPLPRSISHRRLGLSLLKGEQRRELWDLNDDGGGGGDMLLAVEIVLCQRLRRKRDAEGLRKVSPAEEEQGEGAGAGVAHFPVLPEEAGMAASSTLRLPETVVTSAVVFDNAARAQPTGRRHNRANRRTSQMCGHGVISNDSRSKRKKQQQQKNPTRVKINRTHLRNAAAPSWCHVLVIDR